jgi:hypothetical protein
MQELTTLLHGILRYIDDEGASVSLPLLRASFLEQPLDGGDEWWSGVHLPRRRRRDSMAWSSGTLVMGAV